MSKRAPKTIHVEYCRAYHEVLSYEEISDVDLNAIFQSYLKVLSRLRGVKNLNKPPLQEDIDLVVNEILADICEVKFNME